MKIFKYPNHDENIKKYSNVQRIYLLVLKNIFNKHKHKKGASNVRVVGNPSTKCSRNNNTSHMFWKFSDICLRIVWLENVGWFAYMVGKVVAIPTCM